MEIRIIKGPRFKQTEEEVHRKIAAIILERIKEDRNAKDPLAK